MSSSGSTALQRILIKTFQDIQKDRKYIRSEDINRNVQRALEVLKNGENIQDRIDYIVQPLQQILQSPSNVPPHAISCSLSGIQQLLTQNMVPEHPLSVLMEAMVQLLYTDEFSLSVADDSMVHTLKEEEENLHLKILQINLMIISSGNTHFNQNLFSKLLALFFRMHRTRNINVSQTAAVAIQQTTNLIFDTLAKANVTEQNDQNLSTNTFATAKSAYLFFSDLCLLAQKNEARWLKLKNTDQTFVLELLEDVLKNFSQVILKYDDFVTLLRDKISKILVKQLQNNEIRFPLTLRLFRVAAVLSKLLYVEKLQNGCFEYLDFLTEMTRDDTVPFWKRVLALEVFRQICADHALLKRTFEQTRNIEQPNNLLNKICSSIRFCIEKLMNSENSQTNLTNFQHAANQYQRLDTQMGSQTPFQSSGEECLAICIDCLTGIIQCMSILAVLNIPEPSSPESKETAREDLDSHVVRSRETCSNMVESVWCPVLVSLSTLLENCNEEDTINTVLRAYLLFIHSCSAASKYTARDAFLTNLCKFSPVLPKQSQSTSSNNVSGGGGMNTSSGNGSSESFTIITLSKKKILVAQTIVDVAQAIGEHLGSSWNIVLQAFVDLNEVIIDFQKNSALGSMNTFASDLKNISKSMDSLMQSTKQYSDQHLSNLVKSLCRLSRAEMNHDIGGGNMFSAAQTVIILKLNISRINVVWDIVQPHMLSMIEHEDAMVRQQGIQDIFELIHEFFSPHNHLTNSPVSTPSESEMTFRRYDSVQEEKEHVELDIFTLLLTISSSRYVDSKQEMIESLTIVIEQYGELISSAWTIILTVLRSIEQNIKLIPLAFKSLQLIGGNIQYLTQDGLIEYMKTIQFFALQQSVEDFNISLVAISLLWNLSDFMVKSDFGERKMELFITLFTTLRKSVVDPRPEVRNAAVRTLLFAVASHGAELNASAWESVVQKVLIPVLKDMQACAEHADQTVVNYTLSKQQKKMYVHHSRNTEAKQWSETNCLAIENISRVLKEHSEVLATVPNFTNEGCEVITSFITSSFEIQTGEVARVIIHSMFDVFRSTKGEIQRSLWDGLWPLWVKMKDAALEGKKYISNNLLAQLVENFTALYKSLDEQEEWITQADVLNLAHLMKEILFSKSATNMVSHPSPCQKCVLTLLGELSQYSDEVCLEIFNILIDILPSEEDIRSCILKKKSLDELPHVHVASAILNTLVDQVFQNASSEIQRKVFLRVIRRLGHLMKTKFIPHFEYEIWRPAILSFNTVVRSTLEQFNSVSQVEAEAMWTSLCIAMEEFLVPKGSNNNNSATLGKDKSQSEETILVNLIDTTILPASRSASDSMKRRLLRILEDASRTAPRAIATESMRCFFRVVALASEYLKEEDNKKNPNSPKKKVTFKEDSAEEISEEEKEIMIDVGICAIPILYSRCREIIIKYIQDDELTGEMPLPSYRRLEVMNVFQQLKEHELHSRLCLELPTDNERLSSEILNGPKGMLIRLFPQLCKFTRSSIQDPSLKSLLCDILSILSTEFGFPS